MIRLSRSKRQLILFIAIGVVLVATTIAALKFLYINQLKDSYELKLTKANNLIAENKKELYVTKEEIKKGEIIDSKKIRRAEIFTNLEQSFYISERDLGKVAVINIPVESPIYKNMVTESLQDDLREEEFNVFYLNSNLKSNDYVDIRILYPNGENYIVLSKKPLKNVSLQNSNCYMWLDANETHYISSAIVDAYLNQGTKLYTTKYIEPNIQDESEVTYTPKADVIELINRDPNVINKAKETLSKSVRESLEQRLDMFYQEYSGEVQWGEKGSNMVYSDEMETGSIDNGEAEESSTGNEEGEFDYVE